MRIIKNGVVVIFLNSGDDTEIMINDKTVINVNDEIITSYLFLVFLKT